NKQGDFIDRYQYRFSDTALQMRRAVVGAELGQWVTLHQEQIPNDCVHNGCDADEVCQLCQTRTGSAYICIPRGSACSDCTSKRLNDQHQPERNSWVVSPAKGDPPATVVVACAPVLCFRDQCD